MICAGRICLEVIILPMVFLLVIGALILFIRVRKLCKTDWEYHNKGIIVLFYIVFVLVMLTGIRHLNPLRWPPPAVRVILLGSTPIGTTWDEVHQHIYATPGWSLRSIRTDFEPNRDAWRAELFHPRTPYFIPPPEGRDVFVGVTSTQAILGSYRFMFIARIDVLARWVFDENGRLIDILVGTMMNS